VWTALNCCLLSSLPQHGAAPQAAARTQSSELVRHSWNSAFSNGEQVQMLVPVTNISSHVLEHRRILSVVSQDSHSDYLSY